MLSGLLIFFIYFDVKHCNIVIAQDGFSYLRIFVLPHKFLKIFFSISIFKKSLES